MATMTVRNATGGIETIEKPLAAGRTTPAASRPVALDSDIFNLLTSMDNSLALLEGYLDGLESLIAATNSAIAAATLTTFVNVDSEYETIAASQTAQVLGATGATGDYISHAVIVPATTTPGAVTLLDNATSIPLFAGGTVTVQPFVVELKMKSVSGAWKITTGADVSVIAVGSFT